MADTLSEVALSMWEGDCGAVPVVDGENRPIAMVTDRDICMAALLTGKPLHEISVERAASTGAQTIHEDAFVDAALAIMRQHRVRRLPIVDVEGRLVGMLSSADIVRSSARSAAARVFGGLSRSRVTWALSGISEPRDKPALNALRTR
jgi:CBS domain-containing protein